MSWLTPFQNLIIRFKLGSGGNTGGGITEDYLNSKLAAFYTATETKLLNLLNQQLTNYVLKTNFNELSDKVTELENTINNLPNSPTNGVKLSHITGTINVGNTPTTLSNLSHIASLDIKAITLPTGAIIQLSSLRKYIITWNFAIELPSSSYNGYFINLPSQQSFALGQQGLSICETIFLTSNTTPQNITWYNGKAKFGIDIILSNTIEEITNTISQQPMTISENTENTIQVIKWENIGGD